MATIDQSAAASFWNCPRKYYESYIRKIEPAGFCEPLAFGTRVHELLARWFGHPGAETPLADETLEAEAQEMIAAYGLRWPREQDGFEVLACEQTFRLPCGSHTFRGRFDGIVRLASGHLAVLEHKTERRGAKRNSPETWAVNPQVGLYTWAASQVYGEPVDRIILDVLTRRSPKGREAPSFRRDEGVQCLPDQQAEALRNLTWIGDAIDRAAASGSWAANRTACVQNGWKCDFYPLHLYGTDENSLRLYQPKPDYLEGL